MSKLSAFAAALLIGACASNQPPEVTHETPAPVITAAPAIEENPPTPEIVIDAVLQEPEPNELLSKTPEAVVKMIGVPNFVRRDARTQSMLFDGAECVLEVFFYTEEVGRPFSADYITARTPSGDTADAKACLLSRIPGGWLDTPSALDAGQGVTAQSENTNDGEAR